MRNGNGKQLIICSFPDTLHQANGKAKTERDIHYENHQPDEVDLEDNTKSIAFHLNFSLFHFLAL